LEVTRIPAGSVGDRQFHAAWQDERTVTFDSISAKGYRAQPLEDSIYQARIPSVTTLTADDIQVIGLYEGAVISAPAPSDDGESWTFSVSCGRLTRQYTLRIVRSATAEMGIEAAAAIQATLSREQVTLDVVPEDMTIVIAGYRDGQLVFLAASTCAETATRSVSLPPNVGYDSLRLFHMFDWLPIAPERSLWGVN